jgi:hypothetical protein
LKGKISKGMCEKEKNNDKRGGDFGNIFQK